jgi:hypothetical protein
MRAFLVLAGLCALAGLVWLATRATERESSSLRDAGASSEATGPGDEVALPAPASASDAEARTALAPAAGRPRVQWQEDAERASAITGRVRRADGTPCPRAELRYVWDEEGRPCAASARSDDEGRFVVEPHAPDARGDLLAFRTSDAPAVALGVAAGTQGLELVLASLELLTLEVRGARGETLASAEATFSWQLSGHLVQDLRWRRELAWELPPVPFAVEVSARGHRTELFGPFDPADLGARLVLALELEPLPGVRGRVTHGGQAVPGAEVSLRAVASERRSLEEWGEPEGNAVRADAEGRFEFPQPRGRHELIAFAVPQGQGVLGPLELDGETDVDGLELELTRALGSIEGRVLLPAGHGPEELWLQASEGNRPLRADGGFTLPDLPPGPFTVSLGISPLGNSRPPLGERWIRPSHPLGVPEWLPTDPSYTVEVVSGRCTRLEIDLASPAACRLAGVLRIDGLPPPLRAGNATSSFVERSQAVLDRGPRTVRQSAAALDAEGTFQLSAHGPGEYRLELGFGIDGARNETWAVRTRVALAPGVLPWRLDLATGSLHVVGTRGVALPGLTAVWIGPDGTEVRVSYPELDTAAGEAFFQCVPAGTVRLGTHGAAPDESRECEVRAGFVSEVRWSP